MKVTDYFGKPVSDIERASHVGIYSSSDFDTISVVSSIIRDVIESKDKALIEYTKKFDKYDLTSKNIKVTKEEIKEAYSRVDRSLIAALEHAHKNIKKFHSEQYNTIKRAWQTETEAGVVISERTIPLESIGAYIPGGRATYPSTVLMTCTPAKVAGVRRIVVTSPPPISDAILAACYICEVDEVYRIGGAQAIAAIASGTQSVRRVDKIVGPGNKYVNTAKLSVYGMVDIDMPAGPSEVMIIADAKADAKIIASDLLAQAEHDPDARCVLITESLKKEIEIRKEIELQKAVLKRITIIQKSLEKNFLVCRTKSVDESVAVANMLAPEHLEIITENADSIAEKIMNAGTVFVGPYSPVSAGDYASGSNHVLPTGMAARFSSSLGVRDYLKSFTTQMITKQGLLSLKKTIETIAGAESLDAHAQSVRKRFE
jgi:histidinol dehydrogenase